MTPNKVADAYDFDKYRIIKIRLRFGIQSVFSTAFLYVHVGTRSKQNIINHPIMTVKITDCLISLHTLCVLVCTGCITEIWHDMVGV